MSIKQRFKGGDPVPEWILKPSVPMEFFKFGVDVVVTLRADQHASEIRPIRHLGVNDALVRGKPLFGAGMLDIDGFGVNFNMTPEIQS